MRELRNTKIIAVDHGYGNIKTANTVTPTGIKAYETEPIFTGNILEYNDIFRKRQGPGQPNRIYVKLPKIRGSKESRSPYGKFQNVFLSEKELEDIRQTIPDWKDYIERLSGYMAVSYTHLDVYKRQIP